MTTAPTAVSPIKHMVVPGSTRQPWPGAALGVPVAPDATVDATIVLRRRAPLPHDAGVRMNQAELADRHGADPSDLARVAAVLEQHGITVTGVHRGSRRISASGPAAAIQQVFGTALHEAAPGAGVAHRLRTGPLKVPQELDGLVTAVLGLDDRPQARTQHRLAPARSHAGSFTALQVGAAYKFPAAADGTGQTLAIIELGGGFGQADLDQYFAGLGMSAPSVTAVGVDGAVNTPGADPAGADGEVLLDIEVCGALAPGAAQFVYFAPNTDRGFLDAVSEAVHATPTPAAVSISWGQSEDAWTAQALAAMDQAFADAAVLGVVVCAASGDNGAGDGAADGAFHVDFPASSTHVLACGGTSLHVDEHSGAIKSETVWNGGPGGGSTGGGVSDTFPLPAWQAGAGVPKAGRGVPDVAGNADPATGYRVVVDGKAMVIGGTSAVAPLWAALVCRLTEVAGRRLGPLQPALYQGAQPGAAVPGLHDVTSGDNTGYTAGPGWDACTGLGTPDGAALFARLTHASEPAGPPRPRGGTHAVQ